MKLQLLRIDRFSSDAPGRKLLTTDVEETRSGRPNAKYITSMGAGRTSRKHFPNHPPLLHPRRAITARRATRRIQRSAISTSRTLMKRNRPISVSIQLSLVSKIRSPVINIRARRRIINSKSIQSPQLRLFLILVPSKNSVRLIFPLLPMYLNLMA